MLTEEHAGEKVALLAQLKLPLATRSNDIPPDKRILLPAPHALPCAPGGGTDVPWSQYSGLCRASSYEITAILSGETHPEALSYFLRTEEQVFPRAPVGAPGQRFCD